MTTNRLGALLGGFVVKLVSMKIRKTILRDVNGCNDKAMLTKSLAMIILYQMKVSADEKQCRSFGAFANRIANFSYNKIKRLTGLHINTIKKRIKVAKQNGWISFVGNDLVINKKKFKSSHQRNNYTLANEYKNIVELQDVLLSLIIVNTQERKEFVKDIFDKLKSPNNLNEYKKARRFVREKYPQCDSFNDNGISYKYLTTALGIKKTKLGKLIKFAIEKQMIEKKRNIVRYNYEESIYLRQLSEFSLDYVSDFFRNKFGRFVKFFFTKHNLYLCFANSYRSLLV